MNMMQFHVSKLITGQFKLNLIIDLFHYNFVTLKVVFRQLIQFFTPVNRYWISVRSNNMHQKSNETFIKNLIGISF